MKPFSPRMFPHRVHKLSLAEGRDADAGVTEAFAEPAPAAALPCRVRVLGTRVGIIGDDEVSVTLADVALPADPAVKKGDHFRRADTGGILRVLAAAKPRDADGVLFVVACQVIE